MSTQVIYQKPCSETVLKFKRPINLMSLPPFFEQKVKDLMNQIKIDNQVYNGIRNVVPEDKMFIDPVSVKECILSLKSKKTEGVNRIPQCVLLDGAGVICQPLTKLLIHIYSKKNVPDQWLEANKDYPSL
jgi:hypothetical protein